jgi:hypothetical protein
MIEDKKDGIKIAESPQEALITSTIANIEAMVVKSELELELHGVVLAYLRAKKLK